MEGSLNVDNFDGSTKTWNQESGNGTGITETETETESRKRNTESVKEGSKRSICKKIC